MRMRLRLRLRRDERMSTRCSVGEKTEVYIRGDVLSFQKRHDGGHHDASSREDLIDSTFIED